MTHLRRWSEGSPPSEPPHTGRWVAARSSPAASESFLRLQELRARAREPLQLLLLVHLQGLQRLGTGADVDVRSRRPRGDPAEQDGDPVGGRDRSRVLSRGWQSVTVILSLLRR